MNMKKTKILLSVAACLLAGGLLIAQDASGEQAAVNLSKPGQPALLKIHLVNGGITVRVHNRPEVIVESKPSPRQSSPYFLPNGIDGDDEKTMEKENKHAGMKRISGSSDSLTIEEKDNVVTVVTESWMAGCDLTVTVPLHTSLKLNCVNGGGIRVEGVEGEIEAVNVNGPIILTGIAGSAVANTTNGKVICSFTRIDPAKPISFASFNGDVDVTFPAGLKANVLLKTQNGDIYSDFDVNVNRDSQKTVEDKRAQGGKFRIVMDKSIAGSINGGGVTVTFKTFNGDILLRKAK
jgi:DUF4097 and DUF4098 domain-containing protein YvlB